MTRHLTYRLTRRLLAGVTILFGAALVTECSSDQVVEPDTEPVANIGAAVVLTNMIEQAHRWGVLYLDTSTPVVPTYASEYTVAAIGPQSAPAHCATGGA